MIQRKERIIAGYLLLVRHDAKTVDGCTILIEFFSPQTSPLYFSFMQILGSIIISNKALAVFLSNFKLCT